MSIALAKLDEYIQRTQPHSKPQGDEKEPSHSMIPPEEQVTPQALKTAHIESTLLGGEIIAIGDTPQQGYVTYTAAEIKLLGGISPEELLQVHAAKKWVRGTITERREQP